MAGSFLSPDGDLEKLFVNDSLMIDQFAKTGSLWMMGGTGFGEIGAAGLASASSPVQTVASGTNWKQVSCHWGLATSAIKTDGTLWIYGRNNYGQMGNNTILDASSPIQTIAAGTNWKQTSGSNNGTAAIKTDGTLWLWGLGDGGVLGDNTVVRKSSPVQTIAGGTNWQQVSSGSSHTASIKTDGTLWLWGSNGYGPIATGSTTSVSSPVQTIAAGTNWKLVSCGWDHTTTIKTDGTLWIWGRNQFGQLGDNTVANKSSPVQTISSGTNWKLVSGGRYHTGAIKTDGTLWLWGRNSYGELGNSTLTPKSSPIQTISGGTNWKKISAGHNHTAAIKTDGTLWMWGHNNYGGLGTNDIVQRSSPVQTVAGGTNWKEVSATGGRFGGGSTGAIYFYDADNLYPGA